MRPCGRIAAASSFHNASGPLPEAVSKAADYAGKSIAPGTVATYKGDWADFCQWARQNGVDPTALPVHPVVIAAWLVGWTVLGAWRMTTRDA